MTTSRGIEFKAAELMPRLLAVCAKRPTLESKLFAAVVDQAFGDWVFWRDSSGKDKDVYKFACKPEEHEDAKMFFMDGRARLYIDLAGIDPDFFLPLVLDLADILGPIHKRRITADDVWRRFKRHKRARSALRFLAAAAQPLPN